MPGKTRERIARNVRFEPVEEAVTYDFIDSNQLLAALGGDDTNLMVRNARLYKAIGLDSTRYFHDPERHWLWGTFDIWTRFFGVNPREWEVAETGGTAWFSKRPFENVNQLEKKLPQMPNKIR